MALANPDEYAWRLFFFLNHQAELGVAGRPDETKKFGQIDSQAPLVWETWALASGEDKSEVFRPDGGHPVPWERLDRTRNRLILDQNLEREMIEHIFQLSEARALGKNLEQRRGKVGRKSRKSRIARVFPPIGQTQEVRMNRATFDSVVNKFEMYNADGLESLLARGRQTGDRSLISLPASSKEVKAEWRPIEESQKTRYLWRTDDKKQVWGLVALHIITKDLPNWFWADFGHIDCESKINACRNIDIPIDPPIDSTTRGPDGAPGPAGANGIRRETQGTIWANYLLRGTQTSFTKATGRATTLFNPVLEDSNTRSSCIACHALAAVGSPVAGELPNDHSLEPLAIPTGSPSPNQFGDTPDCKLPSCIRYLQTDFMWAPIKRAKRKQ